MKKISFVLVLTLLLFMNGCSKQEKESYDNFNYIYADRLVKDVFIDSNSGLKNPTAMACGHDTIYIASSENDCIYLYDYDGKYIKSFGETGNGEGEFLSPAAIAIGQEGLIYVADANTGRIQVVNKDGIYQNHFTIDEIKEDGNASIFDVEVDNKGNIYATVSGFNKNIMKIYKIDSDGRIKEIGSKQIGVLGKDSDGNIYYAQTYELIKDGYGSGECYLAEIKDDKCIKIKELPNKYTPTGISISNDYIYLFSYYNCSIDKFSVTGDYIETLYQEDASQTNRGMSHMAINNQGTVFVSDSENNTVYSFSSRGD